MGCFFINEQLLAYFKYDIMELTNICLYLARTLQIKNDQTCSSTVSDIRHDIQCRNQSFSFETILFTVYDFINVDKK